MTKNKRNAYVYRLLRELRTYQYDYATFDIVAAELAQYMQVPGNYRPLQAKAVHKYLWSVKP